jgi:hypothetical protein
LLGCEIDIKRQYVITWLMRGSSTPATSISTLTPLGVTLLSEAATREVAATARAVPAAGLGRLALAVLLLSQWALSPAHASGVNMDIRLETVCSVCSVLAYIVYVVYVVYVVYIVHIVYIVFIVYIMYVVYIVYIMYIVYRG